MKKQEGMTLLGMIFWVIGIIFISIFIMRVVPVYIENYEVRSSIKALKKLDSSNFSEDPVENASILRSKLINQFTINGFNDFKSEQITITPTEHNIFIVSIKYVKIRPLMYNISLMFDFNEYEEVTVGQK